MKCDEINRSPAVVGCTKHEALVTKATSLTDLWYGWTSAGETWGGEQNRGVENTNQHKRKIEAAVNGTESGWTVLELERATNATHNLSLLEPRCPKPDDPAERTCLPSRSSVLD